MTTLDQYRDAALAAEKFLQDAVPQARRVAERARQERAALTDRDLSRTAKGAELARINQAAADRVADLNVGVARAVDAITTFITRGTAAEPGGGVEGEMKRQAGWQRVQSRLAGSKAIEVDATQILQKAAARGDRAELEGARRELGAFMEGRGQPMSHELAVWLDAAAGPEAAVHARAIEARATKGVPSVKTGLNLVAHHIADPSGAWIVPHYEGVFDDTPDAIKSLNHTRAQEAAQ